MRESNFIEHIKIGYLPLVRLTFDTAAAEAVCTETVNTFKELGINLIWNYKPSSDEKQAAAAVKELTNKGIDVLIMQTTTFVDGRFALAIAQNWNGPIVLWSVDEPNLIGRLKLNSLTGANLLANTLYNINRKFKFVHGNVNQRDVISKIIKYIAVVGVLKDLNGATLGIFGDQPAGYYPSAIDELGLAGLLGINIKKYGLNDIFSIAQKISDSQAEDVLSELSEVVDGIKVDDIQTNKSIKAYLALRDIVNKDKLLGIAVECWPGFFNDYGSAACAALSELNELGIMAACEADVNGLVSIIIESYLSDDKPYLGDMVRVDRNRNSAIFWHCGAGARSLAAPGYKPLATVQPNRKQGLAYDFILKPGEVTVMRLSKAREGFRMVLMSGHAVVDNSSHFSGTSVEIEFDKSIDDITERLIYNGVEHHYCIGYGDQVEQLLDLAKEINIDVLKI